jgi:hypothetical protein
MQYSSLAELTNQCTQTDLAFFDLLRSIAEIHAHQHELSAEELSQLQIGAQTLNGILRSKAATNHSMQLV